MASSSMKLVTLATFRSELAATLAKNALEEKGIRATFSGGRWAPSDWAIEGVSLVVAEKDLERASEILNEAWEYGSLHGGT